MSSNDDMIIDFEGLEEKERNIYLCELRETQKKTSSRKVWVDIQNVFNYVSGKLNSSGSFFSYPKAKAYIESFKPTYHLDEFPNFPIYQEELANPTLRGELTIVDINRWMLATRTYLRNPAATDNKVETEYSIDVAPYGINKQWSMTDNAGEGSCLIHAVLMAASPNYRSHSVSNIQRGILGRAFRQKVYAEMYRDDDRRIITPSDYTAVKKHIYVDANPHNGEYEVLARKYIEYVGGVRQGIIHPFLDDKDAKQLAVWFNINILILTRNPLDLRYYRFNEDRSEVRKEIGIRDNKALNIIIFHLGNHYITIHNGSTYLFTFAEIKPIIDLYNERTSPYKTPSAASTSTITKDPGIDAYASSVKKQIEEDERLALELYEEEAINASILNEEMRARIESNTLFAAKLAAEEQNALPAAFSSLGSSSAKSSSAKSSSTRRKSNALPLAFSSLGSSSAKPRSSRRKPNALPVAFSSLDPKSEPIHYPTSIVTSPLARWHETGSAVGILPSDKKVRKSSRSLFEPSPKPLPAPPKSLRKPLSASPTPLTTLSLPALEEISYSNPMRIKSRIPPRSDPPPKPKSCVGRFCEFISFKKTRKGGKRMKRRQTKRRYK
jgi:hypothetical protein